MKIENISPEEERRSDMTLRERLEENKLAAKLHVLDGYFATRSPIPGKAYGGNDMAYEPMTTDDICYELESMLLIDRTTVAAYLTEHGYTIKTLATGSVCWEIYRDGRGIGPA